MFTLHDPKLKNLWCGPPPKHGQLGKGKTDHLGDKDDTCQSFQANVRVLSEKEEKVQKKLGARGRLVSRLLDFPPCLVLLPCSTFWSSGH